MNIIESARHGCWMYKPASTGKAGGFLAALNSLSKKWSRRWVWMTDNALHYAPRVPANPHSEINTVDFRSVLEVRSVDTRDMLSKGAPETVCEFGWILRTDKKDILWAAIDAETRNRMVMFFSRYRAWSRIGKPPADADVIEFLRQQVFAPYEEDGGNNFSDTSSHFGQSSAAFDLEHEATRYEDLFGGAEEGYDTAHESGGENDGGVMPFSRESSSQRDRRNSTASATRGSLPGSVTLRSSQKGAVSASSSAVRADRVNEETNMDEWDDVDGRVDELQTKAIFEQERVRLNLPPPPPPPEPGAAGGGGPSRNIKFAPGSSSATTSRRDLGETRLALEKQIEERKRRAEERRLASALQLNIGGLRANNDDDEDELFGSASPSPRTFAAMARRRQEIAPVPTRGSASSGDVAVLPLASVTQFATMLEDVVLQGRSAQVTGTAIGTKDGLIIRRSGNMELGRFARCSQILHQCELLHPRNHEPSQVAIEDSEGTRHLCSLEFGAYVVVQTLSTKP